MRLTGSCRHLGVRACLVLVPACAALVVFVLYAAPLFHLYVIACVVMKAVGYAVNNPTREMLYVVTSSVRRTRPGHPGGTAVLRRGA